MLDLSLDIPRLAAGIVLAALFAFISFRLKALTGSGAIGTFIIGAVVFGLGGWLCAVPLLFFFISSSFLSGLKNETKLASEAMTAKAGPRDIKQVLANGCIATICLPVLIVTGSHEWFYLYLASLGAAAADTWATEIGTLKAKKPISVITLKTVAPGTSGGVSIPGTLAALAGSGATVFSAFVVFNNDADLSLYFYAAIIGFLGSAIDSLMGATIQASYKCRVCHAVIELNFHCGQKAKHLRGMQIINNDAVNFLSNLIVVALMAWLIF